MKYRLILSILLGSTFFFSCATLSEYFNTDDSSTTARQSSASTKANYSNAQHSLDKTKQQLLMRYIAEGDLDGVKKAVTMGATVDFGPDHDSPNYPMIFALIQHHLTMDLASGGAGIRDRPKMLPIINYIKERAKNLDTCIPNYCVVKEMCDHSVKQCKKAIDEWGLSASNLNMRYYRGTGHKETFDYLMSKNNNAGAQEGILDNASYIPMDQLKKLLDSGGRSQINNYTHKSNFPLLDVVDDKNVEKTKLLLQYGADVNKDCEAPLYRAIRKNSAEIVKILLEAGAKANPECRPSESKKSPLAYAMRQYGDTKAVIDLLVDFGAN